MKFKKLSASQREKVTTFQASVLDKLMEVPEGSVTTYHDIAKAIHCKSNQAVGQALRRNPFSPEVPCHRVVKGDLTLGGYGGSFAKAPKKLGRLENEGVTFHKNKKGEWIVDESCLHRF